MTVALGDEDKPKLKKMITSQDTSMTKNGMGNERIPARCESSQRSPVNSPLTCKARD